jgi:ABC-2 type transport system permease protein
LIALLIGLCAGLAGGVGGLVVGALALGDMTTRAVGLVWFGLVAGFLFFWVVGLMSDLQKSETIDLARLMHLPVSLRDVFYLNYLTSNLTLSVAVFMPAMLGLAAGSVVGRNLSFVLLIPMVVVFFFMVTAWTYCLRGWLASIMINPRRRRAIAVGITILAILCAQLPNLLVNVWARAAAGDQTKHPVTAEDRAIHRAEAKAKLLRAFDGVLRVVPVLWLPAGARGLADGRLGPVLWGGLGMLGLGAVGLQLAYRSTLRFHGADYDRGLRRKVQPTRSASQKTNRRLLVERKLPWVPDPVAAVAMANLRSMMRAPEFKMALASELIFLVIGGSLILGGRSGFGEYGRLFLTSGAVVVVFIGLIQILGNQFGFDRDGFRSLVLTPVPRWQVLAGKNLAFLPFVMGVFAVILGVIAVLVRLSGWLIVSAFLQFVAAFLAVCMAGNLSSVLVPYRISPGSLRATKNKATTVLFMMVVHMLFPLAMAPLWIAPLAGMICGQRGWLPAEPVVMVVSGMLLIGAGLFYGGSLSPLGRLLAHRERAILDVVTRDVE